MDLSNRGIQRQIIIFTAVSFLCLTIQGCEPLRKKFVRQKKKDQGSEVVPVLEPITYPPRTESSKEMYAYHYSLWKVWYKELLVAIEESENSKRELSFLEQLQKQLEGMKRNLSDDKEGLIKEIEDNLNDAKDELNKTKTLRNIYLTKRMLDRADKNIRRNFNPKLNLTYR
ncbi:MAG: hypothetical protein HQL27_07535 [Candidatus Omnitrophica bacterium]|nr:hypothetical protein [Candidatus Omnitrophota bacterium]